MKISQKKSKDPKPWINTNVMRDRLIQQLKEMSSNEFDIHAVGGGKINSAYDAIQAIKLLRREVVDGMKNLMKLAKQKQSVGMLPICEDMISKTRILLSLWDPSLVEEALNFIEENKVASVKNARCEDKNHGNVLHAEADTPIVLSPPGSIKGENVFTYEDNAACASSSRLEPPHNVIKFLDTSSMCDSPSANYYKPSDEPEPWDLTQLNIEASVMCLASKIKFLCGKCSSPAVRLKSQNSSSKKEGGFKQKVEECAVKNVGSNGIPADRPRNKFVEGLDFDALDDWAIELKPSMRKLRQAMDGLLKTARLTHSVFRIQEDRRVAQKSCKIRYRRHVCFSQVLSSLVASLMSKLWCQKPDPAFLHILMNIGPLALFESLLSYYGDEIDMWGDMIVAIEDLSTVSFTLIRSKSKNGEDIYPKVIGSRSSLEVLLPVADGVYNLLPSHKTRVASFRVTPIFFNVGINEMATIAESLGATRPQDQSNADNFDRLNEYYYRLKKFNFSSDTLDTAAKRYMFNIQQSSQLSDLMQKLRQLISSKNSKNVGILSVSSEICRKLKGLKFTSCKSAKDRTGMAVTLEQCNILKSEYDLAEHEFQKALDCMRSVGVRRENALKNVGIRKYAFNCLQILALPKQYRPPSGTYGSVQS